LSLFCLSIFLGLAESAASLPPAPAGIPIQKGTPCDTTRLDGVWVVESVSWCNRRLPFTKAEKRAKRLTFGARTFTDQLGSKDAAAEEGTYRVDLAKSPGHLDLAYTKGPLLAVRKCIFDLQGDELRIAFSLPYLPGTREQELERARKMFDTRPASFVSGPDDSTVVFVLRRQRN
jgi:uncharacterized protein (TIGR03067 family)